jgi:hypothetical protein
MGLVKVRTATTIAWALHPAEGLVVAMLDLDEGDLLEGLV